MRPWALLGWPRGRVLNRVDAEHAPDGRVHNTFASEDVLAQVAPMILKEVDGAEEPRGEDGADADHARCGTRDVAS
jgi:hypothetical protein